MINNFKELEVWKLGMQIVKEVYQVTRLFPKEFKQFLNIASGSMAEVETQLIIAKELDYFEDRSLALIVDKLEVLNKMTYKLSAKIL